MASNDCVALIPRALVVAGLLSLAIVVPGCTGEAAGGNTTGAGPQATKVGFVVQPSTALAGSPLGPSIQVAVQDQDGNTINNSSVAVSIGITPGAGISGASLTGSISQPAVNGIATFGDLRIDKAGSGYTLSANAPSLATAVSSAFSISPAAPAKLAFITQPTAVGVGTVISPAVQVGVRDAYDNVVTNASTTVILGITGGSGTPGAALGGTLTRTASNGAATFNNITVDKAGTGYLLSAAASGLTNATSNAFDIAGAAAPSCANPAPQWIWCDDFEIDRFTSYFEVATQGGSMARVAGVGRNGSAGIRSRFASGQVSAGSLKLAFGRTPDAYFRPVDAGTRDYREIYWRFYVRNQPGWTGGGGDKLTRLTVFAASSWAQAMIAHVWSGSPGANMDYLVIDPASGTDVAGTLKTTQYNDFANLRWLGLARGVTPLFASANVGQWYCIESHVRLNTAGQSDGLFELRINDQPEATRTGLNWLGNYSAYGLNAIMLESYWNAGSPAAQERYFDDFIVSEAPIGC